MRMPRCYATRMRRRRGALLSGAPCKRQERACGARERAVYVLSATPRRYAVFAISPPLMPFHDNADAAYSPPRHVCLCRHDIAFCLLFSLMLTLMMPPLIYNEQMFEAFRHDYFHHSICRTLRLFISIRFASRLAIDDTLHAAATPSPRCRRPAARQRHTRQYAAARAIYACALRQRVREQHAPLLRHALLPQRRGARARRVRAVSVPAVAAKSAARAHAQAHSGAPCAIGLCHALRAALVLPRYANILEALRVLCAAARLFLTPARAMRLREPRCEEEKSARTLFFRALYDSYFHCLFSPLCHALCYADAAVMIYALPAYATRFMLFFFFTRVYYVCRFRSLPFLRLFLHCCAYTRRF